MTHSTSFTYQLKREILSFSNKISKCLSKPDRKFFADMLYGILASRSCLLTDISDKLLEPCKKINTVDRLSAHLTKGTPKEALNACLALLRKWCPAHPVILIDDSDVVKPDGCKFEDLGWVRDGSKSTSSKEKDFTSINDVAFSAMERAAALFGKAAFIMDEGYDDNKMFLKLDSMGQDYVIRLTSRRKLLCHNKWVSATELRNRRKGKVKLPLFYKGKMHEAYLSHVKVQITASRKDIYLVLVYGITEHPMMLATNREIRSKDDVIRAAMLYFSRWKIEEYFRCKKQVFQFENFRVRKLKAINALNFYITLCMAFLAHMSVKSETNVLKTEIIRTAKSIREKVAFCYYRLAKGISGILSHAKEGIRLWFRTKRPAYRQLRLKLVV
ncbi:hypothetical protein IMSAGC007_04357 [Lachnospiraceae bacterium]|nr:hypothetical protein IMSAGC007_04357 [Lachnospiraceae bacterium]